MRRGRLLATITVSFAVAATLLISQTMLISAQNRGEREGKGDREEPPPPFYNPYPPGILPSDLTSEIERVRDEVSSIENEGLAQWHALTPPTLTGQPPTLQGTGMRANQLLGKLMNFDEHMSPFKNRACGFCHMPYAGFSGPIPSVNLTMVAYPGSLQFRAGKRTAQRYTYSPDFPVLNFNTSQEAFFGGNFWDSRATGYLLGSADVSRNAMHAVSGNACSCVSTGGCCACSCFLRAYSTCDSQGVALRDARVIETKFLENARVRQPRQSGRGLLDPTGVRHKFVSNPACAAYTRSRRNSKIEVPATL